MAHWSTWPEPRWKEFKFRQPYARGLARLKDEVLAKTAAPSKFGDHRASRGMMP
mgnify:CR=1 FL=1